MQEMARRTVLELSSLMALVMARTRPEAEEPRSE